MSEEKKVLKEGINKVTVVGTLVEKNLKEDSYRNQAGDTVEVIAGTISVRTGENEVHQVRLRSNKYTKDGKENNLYKGYLTVQNHFVSVADVAEAAKKGQLLVADQVSVEGRLATNEYYAQDGRLRQYQQIEGRFVNHLRDIDDPTPRATFDVEIYVSKVLAEMKDDDETGRVIVEGLIPTYNSIVPYKFTVVEAGANYFLYDLENGQTIKMYGKITNVKKEQKKLIPMAFGEPKEEITYSYISESLVGHAEPAYEEENPHVFDPELIKERLVYRAAYLEQQKARQSGESSQSSPSKTFGGGGGAATQQKKVDLPVDVSKLF